MKAIRLIAAAACIVGTSAFAQAPAGPSAESRLREQIKTLTAQIRAAETAQAVVVAEKTALDEKVKAFLKQIEEDGKARAAEKEAAKREAEQLRADLATKEAQRAEKAALHEKAEEFGKKADELAKKTEAERAKLAAEGIALKDTVAKHRAKNAQMYEIATALLERYRKFGLGTALTAREPFVGITRARLETIIEELGAKANDQRIRMDGTSPPTQPASAASPAKLAEAPADKKKVSPATP